MAGRMINGAVAFSDFVRPARDTDESGAHRLLPVLPELSSLLPSSGLRRGSTVAIGLSPATPASRNAAPATLFRRGSGQNTLDFPGPGREPSSVIDFRGAGGAASGSALDLPGPGGSGGGDLRRKVGDARGASALSPSASGRGLAFGRGAASEMQVPSPSSRAAGLAGPAIRGLAGGGSVVAGGVSAAGNGSTSLLLALLAAASRAGSWCAVVGVPTLGAVAAAESGVALDRLAFVPHPGPEWPTVVAALIDGVDVVVVAVPGQVSPSITSRLVARARQRGCVLVPYGNWDGADVTLQVTQGHWEGLGDGHGRLRRRKVTVVARGRGAAARPREITMWMPGIAVPPPREPVSETPTSDAPASHPPTAPVPPSRLRSAAGSPHSPSAFVSPDPLSAADLPGLRQVGGTAGSRSAVGSRRVGGAVGSGPVIGLGGSGVAGLVAFVLGRRWRPELGGGGRPVAESA